ncbi:response regulator transcription factor [Paenibacillus thermotolerans]|uniref:response regulator transcription factor n=1 Tax=Paenibacillus thermotolerans TaxID=3027807 RepID=UPI00236848D7|nr:MULTISPECIES: response regulator [unclassified Paenibacillus]
MYSLLIVEDEVYIANKIKASVHWEELAISEVFIAHNFRQAKERIENQPIDVIICDIEMPQGNGIELLAWLREMSLKIEFIFLTCHSEFEYTKKAIQLGSLDYLLKPVQPEEIKAAVLTAIKKINKERPLIIERFWLDLINQTIPLKSAEQNMPYPETEQFLPVLIGIHHWGKKLSVREENIMEYALRKAAEELMLRGGKGQVVHVKRGILLLVVPLGKSSSIDITEWKRTCEAFIEACSRYFYCELSCYIGDIVPVQEMLAMYEALTEMHLNNVTGIKKACRVQEQSKTKAPDHVQLPLLHVWSEMLKREDKQKLLAEISEFFETWKRIEGLDAKKLQQFYQSFLQMFLYTMQQKGIAADQMFSEHLSPERALSAKRTVASLQLWVTELLETAFRQKKQEESNQTVVDKIKRYITLHIDQALSRQYIADYIGLSPDYMVKLFKKETGLSITDYIVQERMSISKELLVKSDLPVSAIALAVGFTNFAYFSTIFKKETALTPQEYRKTYQQQAPCRP